MSNCLIPEMTDSRGKHWAQPKDIRSVLMDDKTVLLTPEQFNELPEYSTSIPSGVYPGKCWKGQYREGGWYMRWYGDDGDPQSVPTYMRTIEIVKP